MRRALHFALALLCLAACRRPALPEGGTADRDAAAGRRIFERKCASCHNDNGDGRTDVGGDFPYANLVDGVWRSDGSPSAIERQVRTGHDPMPKFQTKLTDQEIRQVVAYVSEMTKPADGRAPAASPRP